ncbi:MAG: hypothetical protein IKA56_00450 [Clostridia bacterium]|nr:hypothetical protein [Clostridia bacterium]
MSACTFFGHRDTPQNIYNTIYCSIKDLIEKQNIDTFYVGNNGNFDKMVKKSLKELRLLYPDIKIYIVLAYIPDKKYEYEDYQDTIYPDNLERVPKRFAISARNNWMLSKSNYVLTYISHPYGGAAKFAETAKKKNKCVINLYSDKQTTGGNPPV